MKVKSLRILIFFQLLFSSAVAQSDSTTSEIKISKPESYFRVNYDNDFFSATDRYYTQGIYLEFIFPFIKKSPLSKLLIPLNKNSINYYGINLEQDGFTPRSIRHDSIYFGERPYASVFFVSHFLVSIAKGKKQRLTSRFDLGIIGPDAKGEEEQKAIHFALKNIQPLGWEYQIAGDYVINYNLKFEKGLYVKKKFEFIGFAASRIGTLYDDLSLGILLRAGRMQSYFDNLGLNAASKKKSIQNVSPVINKKFQFHAFSKGEIKTVAYNATMQGGFFNKNSIYTIPSNDIKRIVAIAYVGVVISYKAMSLEYTKAYISPEFKNGLHHGWGHCNITFCF